MTPSRSADPAALRSGLLFWRWCTVAWFAIFTVATHWPRTDYLGDEHIPPDKLAHFITFGVLALLLERARWLPRGWMAMLIVAAWVPVDEWSQSLVSDLRMSSLSDVLGGLLGVVAATVFLACLRPGSRARRGGRWWRAIVAADLVAGRASGGPLIAVVGTVVGLIAIPLVYAVIWTTTEQSMGTTSLVTGLALAMIAVWPVLRRAWRGVDGPRWPVPGGVAWLTCVVFMGTGWIIGRLMADGGINGLVAPLIALGGVTAIGLALRAGWWRLERAG